jgi:hypothetical protein
VKTPRTECPRCESMQAFVPQTRPVEGKPWMEVFIACNVCRYERVLGQTTREIETRQHTLRSLMSKSRYETERYGQPSVTTSQSIERTRLRLSQATYRLTEEMSAHGSPTN